MEKDKFDNKNNPRIIPAKRWNDYHENPRQGTVNSLMLDRRSNGLDKCVIRLRNRLYIVEDLFFEWLLEHRESK